MGVFSLLKMAYRFSSSKRFIQYLRSQGIEVGGGTIIRSPMSTRIDLTRPSLVTIGENVDINKNFQILTHDYATRVFKNAFYDFLNSSGAVRIGSNIYFGTNVIVLKGVTIGDNCIIAAGSVVTKDIPSNSVAAGVPCRVVCSLEDFYKKRKKQALNEAVEYINSIYDRFGRAPMPSELYEEFVWFVDKGNYDDYSTLIPIDRQLGVAKAHFLETHKALFNGIEDFLKYCRSINNSSINDEIDDCNHNNEQGATT